MSRALRHSGQHLGISARFHDLKLIGKGNIHQVFSAWDDCLKRRVALKLHREDFVKPGTGNGVRRSRLVREAILGAQFLHPHLVATHDFAASHSGITYIVLEFVNGVDLAEYLGRRKRMAAGQVVLMATALARALGKLHENRIAHRDVKPANVLLGKKGEIKICDFSCAQEIPASTRGKRKIHGTPGYIPPEVLLGEAFSEQGDLFSLGVILYECLAGFQPFSGCTAKQRMMRTVTSEVVPLGEIVTELPPAIEDLVNRLLKKKPLLRPAGADEILEELSHLNTENHSWKPHDTSLEEALVLSRRALLTPPTF